MAISRRRTSDPKIDEKWLTHEQVALFQFNDQRKDTKKIRSSYKHSNGTVNLEWLNRMFPSPFFLLDKQFFFHIPRNHTQ